MSRQSMKQLQRHVLPDWENEGKSDYYNIVFVHPKGLGKPAAVRDNTHTFTRIGRSTPNGGGLCGEFWDSRSGMAHLADIAIPAFGNEGLASSGGGR